MEDPNVFLTLKAANEHTTAVFEDKRNDARCIPSVHEHTAGNIDNCSRETTPLSSESKSASILLTFDKKPKQMGRGYTFGTDPARCDVHLGGGSISGVHFSITFDEQRRIILRDSSTNGTTVSYENEGGQDPRRSFTWILFPEYQPIKAQVGDPNRNIVVLTLELPTHETCEAEYQANIASYIKNRTDAEPPLGLLGITSQETTAAPSAMLSPRKRPQYHRTRLLGKGEFGIVRIAVDVSTSCVFAGKKFFKGNWKREVEAMKHLLHEHIVRYIDVLTEPEPELIVEYFPLGNLEVQHVRDPIAVEESAAVLIQGTGALAYLHKKQLAHRDIKPENILVETRRPLKIKLTDFGLAKNISELATRCGSYLYAAPEIFQGQPYTAAVDIWSLGVVVYQYVYGLPEAKGKFSLDRWFKKLMRSILDWDAERMIDFLSTRMLKMNPQERSSADDCHRCSLELFREEVNQRDLQSLPEDSRGGTCTPNVTEPLRNILTTDLNSLVSREAVQNQQNIAEPRSRNSSGERCASKRRCSAIGNSRTTGRVLRRGISIFPTGQVDVNSIPRNVIDNTAKLPLSQSSQRPETDRTSHRLIERSASRANGYDFVTFDGCNVYYRLHDGWVNATQIFNAAKRTRRALFKYLKKHTNISRDIVRGYHTYEGSYISLEQALCLCDEKVPELKSILKQALEKHVFHNERHNEISDNLDESSDEDPEEISSYHEGSPQAGTKDICKSSDGGRSLEGVGNSHSSPGVECEREYLELPAKRSECSNFTEPSFQHGSFLPPLRDSGLQREEPKLRYSEVKTPGCVNNEDLWEGLWTDHSS